MNDTPPTGRQPKEKRFQFSMRAMFIGVTIFAVLLGLLAALGRRARRDLQRRHCSNNLKQIALALHNYHDAWGCFPPAYTRGPDGTPWHSWRILLTPYMESQNFFVRYRVDEPWDGPNNSKLHNQGFYSFHCSADDADHVMTSYVAVVGKGTAWPCEQSTRMADFGDGTFESILVVEVANSGIHWMEPRDLDLERLSLEVNSKSGPSISSMHVKGALVCAANGWVHFLSNDHDPDMLKRLLTINDGEPASWEDDVSEPVR